MPNDFRPTATLETLRWRSLLLRAIRDCFDAAGYWEVETPLLSQETCVDAWLDPFEVHTPGRRFLQTSPEFAMKRLLAAGADSIYQVTRSFRTEEIGSRHNPEFTIVEWYRRDLTYRQQMNFVEHLVQSLCDRLPFAVSARPPQTIPRLTFDAAFEQSLGSRVLQLTTPELLELAHHAHQKVGQRLPPGLDADRDGLLNVLLNAFVEPFLASLGCCFLYDFPASQAALAQVRNDSPPVAERFELYLGDLEICNGYTELTDANELRRRIAAQNQRRQLAGKPPLPPESRLLRAMDEGYPASAGVALGFDRLLMWLFNLSDIQSVQAFPWPFD